MSKPSRRPVSGLVVLPKHLQTCSTSSSPAPNMRLTPISWPQPDIADQVLPMYILYRGQTPNMIIEINRFSQQYGSFLIVPEDTNLVPEVCSNGNMTFVTMIDPLFCMLALIECQKRATGTDVFQPLSSMCLTSEGTDLSPICPEEQFSLICDTKQAAGQSFYRLSEEKVLQWLLAKQTQLSNRDISAQDATDIISQYVPSRWKSNLKSALKKISPVDPQTASDNPETVLNDAELAMAAMMADAKENNRAVRSWDKEGARKIPSTKKASAKTKKKAPPAASAVKFWASQKNGSRPKKNTRGSKRTRSGSVKE